MFKEFGKKITDSNDRSLNRRVAETQKRMDAATDLAYGLNQFLLENKADLENMLNAAGEKAKVKVSGRTFGVAAYPAIKIISESSGNETETILIGVSAPERHYKEELAVEHHRYVRSAYTYDDGYYISRYRPTESGLVIWPYANGHQSDYRFIDALAGFSKIPNIQKVKGDVAWQARKISWRF